jgi:hypothetical protein
MLPPELKEWLEKEVLEGAEQGKNTLKRTA